MEAGTADVFQTVEYSRDKRTMETVPRALLLCLLGLVLALYLDSQPPGRTMLLAFVFMFFVAVVLIAFRLMFEGRNIAMRLLATVFVIVILVALFWDRPGDLLTPQSPSGPRNVPASVWGWILTYGAIGWIAFTLYRHFFPPRPILMLSPAGISFHLSWLRDLLIPWREIQGVEALEIADTSGAVRRAEDATVVLVSKAFYDRYIEARVSSILPSARIFFPKDPSMQILLPYLWFSIDPKHIRAPVEARWKAFRHEPPTDTEPIWEGSQIYATWSIDGSLSQATKFLVPLFGIVAVLVHSAVRQL
jgi:hypothetical protein